MLVPLVFRAALTLTAVAAPDVDEGPTRVVYLGTPGTARAAAFRTFLDERFDEVVVADWRTARSTMALRYGGVSAVVLDGAYEDGRPFLPIREYDVGFGAIDTPPLVVIGAAGRAVARAHGLMGADGRADDARTVHVPPHPTLAPDGGAVAVSTAGRRFGARLGPLRDEPWLEVLAEGGAGEDALAARLTPDEPDPVGVVDALARRDLGPETRAALARFLRDDGRAVLRVVAARAADRLDGVEVPDPAAVGSVVSTDDPRVVLAALEHLESLGPAAAPAVPALRAALSALARPTDAGLATLLRIKGLPRALAAAGAAGVDALVATYPAFLTDDSSLRTTDAGRFGPREPCAEIEFALLAAGPPAARALDDLLTDGPRPLSPPVRAEIAWLRSLFEIAP